MSGTPPHLYRRQGEAKGIPEETITRALARTRINNLAGTTPILSLNHLAVLTGVPYEYLRRVVERRHDPYVDISKPKSTGGRRAIAMPEPMILDVQRFLLAGALHPMELHPCSYAYQKGRSAADCARRHLGASWLIKFDLHDFFGTISEPRVYQAFSKQGYGPLVAFELTRLCTRQTANLPDLYSREAYERYVTIRSYPHQLMGSLPQGAATSGALANAVATDLDRDLSDLAGSWGQVYTRYSDDLTFSVVGPFDRKRAGRLARDVADAVAKNHFVLHDRKTRIIPRRARHIVLGLVLGENDVRLTPEFRRRVEVHVWGVQQRGLVAHARYRNFESLFGFVSHIDGCLAYASAVEPEWAARLRTQWQHALLDSSYPLPVS
jgi:hypothetical protein